MNKEKNISEARKKYLRKVKNEKILIKVVQISMLVILITMWEVFANKGVIDSFIMSQPSRIIKTFLNLSQNDLVKHIGTTCFETIVGFISGSILGTIIAIILWWSKFLSKVTEPFLVVLNSLPKVALRTNNYNMGRSGNACNNCHGSCYIINCNYIRNPKWFYKYR